jgi:IS30 family transposase
MAGQLILLEREIIFKMLNENQPLSLIAKTLHRHHSSIAEEIKRNRIPVFKGSFGRSKCFCQKALDKTCRKKNLCPACPTPNRYCFSCQKCIHSCAEFMETHCSTLERSPYCCNGCNKQSTCLISRYTYSPSVAQEKADKRIREAREGCTLNTKALKDMEQLFREGISKGQAIHHIYIANKDQMFCSERQIYRFIRTGALAISPLDLPRTVQRKLRPKRKQSFKVDKACRKGRTYEDYLDYLQKHPGIFPVEMDTVVGPIDGKKCFLSLTWPHLKLALFYLLEKQTASCVNAKMQDLKDRLQDKFSVLFPLLLTDNGSEFSDPLSLEKLSTKVFYCNPMASYQKGSVENQNSLLRRIVPKGYYLEDLGAEDSDLINSQLNNYIRLSISNRTAYQLVIDLYGKDVAEALGLYYVPQNEVMLSPKLLHGKLKKKHYTSK